MHRPPHSNRTVRARCAAVKIEWLRDSDLPENILQQMQLAADRSTLCEGISVPCSVSVRLCSDEAIREINALHRGIDNSTDVLSFPSVSYPKGKTAGACEKALLMEYDDETDTCFLGDIVIAVPHIYSQAEEYGHSVEREACYLLIHGICHLMGYDHMEESEKAVMRAMEERILSGRTHMR